MSPDIILLIIYFCLSIFFSFLCSILEAVLLSINSTFINVKKKEGVAYADTLEELKKDVDKPLIAILTLNTIAHTVGAIGVGSQANKVFGTDSLTITIVSSVMTFMILVVSEIIPKTIGATYWKGLAGFTANTLKVLMFPLKWTGVLWFLQLFTKLIGGKGHHGPVLTREDFGVMAEMAEKEGVFEETESKVIKNILDFKKVLSKHIMTPASVIWSAQEDMTITDFFNANEVLRFSRIPVYRNSKDEIVGYCLKDEILENLIRNKGDQSLKSIVRPIFVVSRDSSIPKLFEYLIEKREHIALVVDEYGTASGLVTQEDVIETILGIEIMDESDNVADLQLLARKNWEKRAKKIGLYEEEN